MIRDLIRPAAFALLPVVIWALSSCTPMTAKRDDPLIGTIIRTDDAQPVDYAFLLERATRADVIYLGENHENAEHHEIQLTLIRDLLAAGKKPQLGFEFFSVDQTGFLSAFTRKSSSSMHPLPESHLEARLRHDLGWQNRPDRTWRFYFRFLQLAREHELTVFGADLPKGIIRSITRRGLKNLSPVEAKLVESSGFSNDAYRELMFRKFRDAHCGFAVKDMQQRMYDAWLARNDTMASSITAMAAGHPQQPVVMILGGGHTEHNMGVYERVQHLNPDLNQLNIGLTEITRQPAPLKAYLAQETMAGQTFAPRHEYLWFTQRESYEDPCRRFRKHLEAMKKSGDR